MRDGLLSGGVDALDGVTLALAVLLGLAVGSFLNVVIWRVPRGESVVRPRSACPRCGHAIRTRDNVPLVSWLVLRARCRDCHAPISGRYPAVEALTALLFGAVVLRFGIALELVPFLYLAGIGVALAMIDLDVHRLPDVLVLPSYGVVAVALGAMALVEQDGAPLLRAALGGAALFALYFVLAVARPGGMGFGDVKLAGLLGMCLGWIGWGALVVGGFAAFLLGGVYSCVLLLARRAGRRSRVPFGPWMVLGAVVGIGVGESLWQAYLDVALG